MKACLDPMTKWRASAPGKRESGASALFRSGARSDLILPRRRCAGRVDGQANAVKRDTGRPGAWVLPGAVSARPGTMIGDSLRLERHLADGGMASLWLAHHFGLGIRVVVKFPTPKAGHEREVMDRFRREAEILSRIHDSHVVKVYEFVESSPDVGPTIAYLVMEFLDGEDLATRIARLGPLSLVETLGIVDQLSSALESAHSLGIIHRDVKPENVFLTAGAERPFVKLLDFGVARVDGEALRLTCAGATVGTPMYMSPEQLMGTATVDARCDVWSLAIVAYACLTGHAPVQGASFMELCMAIQRCAFDPPSRWRPELPSSMDVFFARALSRRIEERPPTARTLTLALRAAVLGVDGAVSSLAFPMEETAFPLVTRKAKSPNSRRWPSFLPRPIARSSKPLGTALP
jgi:eukaryotic-like serine/threonine-protein kinase